METKTKLFSGLTGNQLKIFALIAMTCDHVGYQIIPQYQFLRWIGRLAFPIFAYMIAEGAYYTKNRLRYFLQIFGLGFLCQAVYFFAMASLYQCILITFSFSILLIYALDHAIKKNNLEAWLLFSLIFLTVVFLAEILPLLLPNTDYAIDYGIWGILTPVFVFLGPKKIQKLLLAIIPLAILSVIGTDYQWISFGALLFLALYNGKRGKLKMKNLFYIYYPLHLVIIYGVSLIVP
ncbi:MAG: hypothetical protein IJA86_03350 [Clostridia bacterium]|nr:hypothetical protein [Clostridia bacterium]